MSIIDRVKRYIIGIKDKKAQDARKVEIFEFYVEKEKLEEDHFRTFLKFEEKTWKRNNQRASTGCTCDRDETKMINAGTSFMEIHTLFEMRDEDCPMCGQVEDFGGLQCDEDLL